jgi:hypothetical protein
MVYRHSSLLLELSGSTHGLRVFFLSKFVCALFHTTPRVSSQRPTAIKDFYMFSMIFKMFPFMSLHLTLTDTSMDKIINYMHWMTTNRVFISSFVVGASGVGAAIYLTNYLTRRPRQAEEPAPPTAIEVSHLSFTCNLFTE